MNLILFLVLGIGAVTFIFSKDILSRDLKELALRFGNEITTIKNIQGFIVLDSIVLAVIKMESGSLYKTKENAEITGDNNLRNKAFGYMQVRKPALLDVNARYGFSYTEQDLLSETVNLTVGIAYLNMCYIKAGEEHAEDVASLTMKKYNAGINIKVSSLRGSLYALNGKNIFNEIRLFV